MFICETILRPLKNAFHSSCLWCSSCIWDLFSSHMLKTPVSLCRWRCGFRTAGRSTSVRNWRKSLRKLSRRGRAASTWAAGELRHSRPAARTWTSSARTRGRRLQQLSKHTSPRRQKHTHHEVRTVCAHLQDFKVCLGASEESWKEL